MSKKSPATQTGNGPLVFMGVIIITLVLIFGLVITFKSNSAPAVTASSNVEVSVASTSHDWGTASMKDGMLEAIFEVKNNGSEVLKLYEATTSCTCTTAQLILGEARSPLFGMHSNFGYVLEVPSGETAQVKAVFDPAFHGPNGVGQISRQVTVKTNDATQPQLSFNITANITR